MAVFYKDKPITQNFYPIGAVMMWPSTTPPPGFLLCDGSEYSSTEEDGKYKELYNIIGTTFGVGTAADSFRVPDCRERFVEGISSTKSVGDKFDAKIPVHKHSFTGTASTSTSQGSHTHSRGTMEFTGKARIDWGAVAGTYVPLHFYDTTQAFSVESENQPRITTNFTYTTGYQNRYVKFKASDSWSGSSSSVGSHSHSFTAKGTIDNASAHNSVYGKSTTIQPASVCLNYVIRYK